MKKIYAALVISTSLFAIGCGGDSNSFTGFNTGGVNTTVPNNNPQANPVVVTAAGDAQVAAAVAQMRALLGNPDNGAAAATVAGTGRREINWDANQVPRDLVLPADFFNRPNQPAATPPVAGGGVRGIVLSTPTPGGEIRVSPVRGGISNSFGFGLNAFSFNPNPNVFGVLNSNLIDLNFVLSGTNNPAGVEGFGAVFNDVEFTGAKAVGGTRIEYFNLQGLSLGVLDVPNAVDANGFSFAGAQFPAGTRVGRVRLTLGNAAPVAGTADDPTTRDAVVVDDFFYTEPRL